MRIISLLLLMFGFAAIGIGLGISLIKDFPDLKYFPSSITSLGFMMVMMRNILPAARLYTQDEVEEKIHDAIAEHELTNQN